MCSCTKRNTSMFVRQAGHCVSQSIGRGDPICQVTANSARVDIPEVFARFHLLFHLSHLHWASNRRPVNAIVEVLPVTRKENWIQVYLMYFKNQAKADFSITSGIPLHLLGADYLTVICGPMNKIDSRAFKFCFRSCFLEKYSGASKTEISVWGQFWEGFLDYWASVAVSSDVAFVPKFLVLLDKFKNWWHVSFVRSFRNTYRVYCFMIDYTYIAVGLRASKITMLWVGHDSWWWFAFKIL